MRGDDALTSYIKTAAMITLLIFIPPLGWWFMHKYSTFDKKTNIALAVVCFAFFIYANISAGNVENILGSSKGFEQSLTAEQFREKFNASSRKLAPNLGIEIAAFNVDGKNFSYEFTPKLKIVGTVDDSGQVTELKIFTQPETKDESFQTINVLGLLIATLNPELDRDDRSEVFRDLRMLKEVSTEGSYDWTTTRGRVIYSVHADSGKVTFTASFS
ncbi:MAG: hypothetical protein IJL14_07900 [Selenomonadaceae bacterium]|nr:hypothetical protein [Selenomonadaceae bacterium]